MSCQSCLLFARPLVEVPEELPYALVDNVDPLALSDVDDCEVRINLPYVLTDVVDFEKIVGAVDL